MKDDNLISFNQDADGNILRNGEVIFPAGTPRDERVWTERDIQLPADRRIADTLKFSGVVGLTVVVEGWFLPGGYEDCVDINNGCRHIHVIAVHGFAPNGEYTATVKGGSMDILLSGPVWPGAKVVDVDLGNISDQSTKAAERVALDLWRASGWGPITYRQLNATKPILARGPYKSKFVLPAFLRPVFAHGTRLLRKWGLI